MKNIVIFIFIYILTILIIRLYCKPMFLSPHLKNKFYSLFEKFINICNEHDITYFIIAGTLLGSIRHKEMIPWDDDIDVGILDSDLQKFQMIDWGKYGLKQDVQRDKFSKVFYKNEYDNGIKYESVFIDVFVFEKIESDVSSVYQYTNKQALINWPNEYFTENELFPLKEYTFKNLTVMGPNNSLNYAKRAWGKNWPNTPVIAFLKYLVYPENLIS